MIDPDFQEKLPKKPNYRNEMVTNDRFRMVIRRPTVGQWYNMDDNNLTLTCKISLKIKCSILNSIFDYLRYQMIESVIPWNKIKENVIF